MKFIEPHDVEIDVMSIGIKLEVLISIPALNTPEASEAVPSGFKEFDKKFLGQIPISTALRESADLGLPLTYKEPGHEISKIFSDIANRVMRDVV